MATQTGSSASLHGAMRRAAKIRKGVKVARRVNVLSRSYMAIRIWWREAYWTVAGASVTAIRHASMVAVADSISSDVVVLSFSPMIE